jgi:photosystem II stability/assembly factor-like uncharacterized protein
MKMTTLLALACAWLALPGPLRAGWVEQKNQPGDGNNNMAVAAGTCDRALVVGTTSGGQGDQPVLWATSDGGDTWQQGNLPKTDPNNPMAFSFWMDAWMLSENLGFLAGMSLGDVGLQQTLNGGQSWTPVQSASGSMSYSGLKVLWDKQHAWVIGDKKIHYTEDLSMWKTASYADAAGEATMSALHFANAFEGWLVGGKVEEDEDTGTTTYHDEGKVLHTTDGGQTWEVAVSGQPYNYSAVWFTAPTSGLMIGNDAAGSQLFRSEDRGKTWTPVTLPAHPSGRPLFALTSLHFFDAQDGWLVGAAGQQDGGAANEPAALHTRDGGLTWVHEPGYAGSGGMFFDVWPCDPEVAYFVGDWGKIVRWQDDGYVPSEGGAEVIVTEDGEVIEPLGPWADVLGAMPDGQVQGNPGAGGGDAAGQADGVAGGDGWTSRQECRDEERTRSDCALGTWSGGAGPGPGLLLLLALGLWVVQRRRGRDVARHARGLRGLGVALTGLVVVNGCGGSETVVDQVCETVSYQQTVSFDTLQGDGAEGQGATSCVWHGAKPALPTAGPRADWTNPFIAYAERVGGTDQLVLLDPVAEATITLTALDNEGARIQEIAWEPGRGALAFVSDHLSAHSTYRDNVFVLALDSLDCFMATPDATQGVFAESGGTMRLSGAVQTVIGGGALVGLGGASVSTLAGRNVAVTTETGGFSLDAPPGLGTLVARYIERDEAGQEVAAYGALKPYDASGATWNVGNLVARKSLAGERLRGVSWRRDGEGFWVIRAGWRDLATGGEEPVERLSRYDTTEGGFTDLALPEEISAELRSLLPPVALSSGVMVLPWIAMDHSGHLSFWFDPEGGTIETIDAPGLTWDAETNTGSRLAAGPQDVLAYVGQKDDGQALVLIGADARGEMALVEREPFTGLAVHPDQIDWSPDGLHLVLTRDDGEASDLISLEVNTLQTEALTTSGAAHHPAWFGR